MAKKIYKCRYDKDTDTFHNVCRFCGKEIDVDNEDYRYIEELDTSEDHDFTEDFEFDSPYLCDDCGDEHAGTCDECGRDYLMTGEDNYVKEYDQYLCPDCYQNYLEEKENEEVDEEETDEDEVEVDEEDEEILKRVKSLKLKKVDEEGLTETYLNEDVMYMCNLVLDNIDHLNKDSDIEVLEYSPLRTDETKVVRVRSYNEEEGDGIIKYGIFFIDKKTNKLLNKFGVVCWEYHIDIDEYGLSETHFYKFR